MSLVDYLKGACLGAVLTSCVSDSSNHSDYPIEKFSPIYFADSPYVKVTGYHGSPDSKKQLFHIKQMHFCMDGDRESYDLINSSQREIYHFLRDLKREGVDEVWVEGLNDSKFECLDYTKNYSNIMSILLRSGLFTKESASGNKDSFKFIPGADFLLGMTGEYKLIPAESFFLHERATLSMQIESEVYENVYKSREDYLVEKIIESDKSQAFFIYGAGHNFIDNVALWNMRNPGKQVSITELTPKTLVDFLKN